MLCAGCNGDNSSKILKQADSLLASHPDSALKLLGGIDDISGLSEEEQMQLAWDRGKAHFRLGISMIEDTLLPRAIEYFRQRGDSAKMLDSYMLEARYLDWTNRNERVQDILDSGLKQAIARKDTSGILLLYQFKAEMMYQNNDYAGAIEFFKKMLQYPTMSPQRRWGLTYKLAINLALTGDTACNRYFEQSADMALAAKDTNMACHYIRNYADYLAGNREYAKSNELIQRVRQLMPVYDKYSVLQMTLATNFINLHQMDSAETYWNIAWKNEQRMQTEAKGKKDFNRLGILAQTRSVLDYASGKDVNITDFSRFSDSIMHEMRNQQNTIVQQLENRQKLQLLNYELTIGRRTATFWLVVSLILLLSVAVGAYVYVRNRYKRLAEAEDRVETLKRLLEDAQKAPDDLPKTENDLPQTKDDAFFKKILLQQLGIIRLVATTPTSHNQALLKQISSISNHEIPVDSLLDWNDLYPIIDKLYNGFYTRLMEKFGTALSDKEIQICCLLCAKFSTKEIGVITQQTSATIYVRKSSIRKKLGVEEKQDIIEFLNSI